MNNDNEIGGDPTTVPHLLPPPAPHPSTVADFTRVVRETARRRDVWEPLVDYDPTSRWYHRLASGRGHEVWLLSWLPGQGSGRHGHGPSHGVFTVLDGELTELTELTEATEATEATGGGRTTRLFPGTLRVFAPGYVHEVVNTALRPAVSLHLYTPGLTEMPMVSDAARHGLPATPQEAAGSPVDHAAPTAGERRPGERAALRTVRRC